MDKEEAVTLPFKHVKRDKTERFFTGKVVKPTADYKIVKPDRALFVQRVAFAPNAGFKEYIDFYKQLDDELRKKYGKTRCDMDVHEIATFFTLGDQDMIVLWDAPDCDTFDRIVAEGLTISSGEGNGYGTSNTSKVTAAGTH